MTVRAGFQPGVSGNGDDRLKQAASRARERKHRFLECSPREISSLWLSYQEHMVDALALIGDEGRG